MSNQLIKETALGRERVFPKNYILNLKDKDSGANLEDILKSFNMLFLPYLGNKVNTRKQVPMSLRHGGLWITYIVNSTVVTEWYDSTAVDDYTWGSDAYWREGSNMLVGDISISKQGTWVVNGEDTGISPKGDKGDSPVIRIYNNRVLVSYDNGVTFEDLNNTPIYTTFRTEGNRLLVSTDLGTTWENCSEPIAAWFRWTDVSGAGNIGKVLISRDLQNWSDLSPTMINNLYIKGYVSIVDNLPSNASIGDIYMVGPTYDESDTTYAYPHYRMWIKLSSGWVDNGEYQSNILIVLTTGLETGITMSLKAITDALVTEKNRILELEKSLFPLVVTLNLSNTLLEYTEEELTISANYNVKHKGVLKLPKTLSLTQDEVVITNTPAKLGTVTIVMNKLGDTVIKLSATAHSYYSDDSSLIDDIISASVSKTVLTVLPIYAGFGTSAEGVKTVANKLSVRTSAAGTYTKTCQADGQNFYILVPRTFATLTSFTMGGAPFVMETSDITLGDYEYKQYKSGAVYNTGATVNIKAS